MTPVGGATFRQDILNAQTVDGRAGLAADILPDQALPEAPAFDRTLRAKLQQQYVKLTKRLGRPAKRLPTLPDVHCLGDLATHIPGGRDRFIQLIQAAMLDNDEQATAWWTVYADLTPAERKVANLDEIGLVAGVPFWDLVGTVARTGARYGTEISQLVFTLLTPDVVVAAAGSAQLPGEAGFPDRQMFLQGSGLVPSPKGHTTEVNVHATANAAAAAETPSRLRFLDDVAEAGEARETVQQDLAKQIEGTAPTSPVFEGVTVEQGAAPVAVPVVVPIAKDVPR